MKNQIKTLAAASTLALSTFCPMSEAGFYTARNDLYDPLGWGSNIGSDFIHENALGEYFHEDFTVYNQSGEKITVTAVRKRVWGSSGSACPYSLTSNRDLYKENWGGDCSQNLTESGYGYGGYAMFARSVEDDDMFMGSFAFTVFDYHFSEEGLSTPTGNHDDGTNVHEYAAGTEIEVTVSCKSSNTSFNFTVERSSAAETSVLNTGSFAMYVLPEHCQYRYNEDLSYLLAYYSEGLGAGVDDRYHYDGGFDWGNKYLAQSIHLADPIAYPDTTTVYDFPGEETEEARKLALAAATENASALNFEELTKTYGVTKRLNRDGSSGSGDHETVIGHTDAENIPGTALSDLHSNLSGVLAGVECTLASDESVDASETGDVMRVYNVTSGCMCKNEDQPSGESCSNYNVRFYYGWSNEFEANMTKDGNDKLGFGELKRADRIGCTDPTQARATLYRPQSGYDKTFTAAAEDGESTVTFNNLELTFFYNGNNHMICDDSQVSEMQKEEADIDCDNVRYEYYCAE